MKEGKRREEVSEVREEVEEEGREVEVKVRDFGEGMRRIGVEE